MKMRVIALGTLLLGAWTIQVRAEEKAKPADAKPIIVPFTLMPTGHFIVSVKINDKGPYKLIFDTGAPTLLLNNRIAKDSGVLGKNASSPLFAPFGAMGAMTVKLLEIGGVKADAVSAVVMDHPTVEVFSNAFKKEHGPIEGIVGFPFFARYKMTVDYQAKVLTFTPNGYQPEDVMQSMMKAIMGASENSGKPKTVAASGQWGLVVSKDSGDDEAGVNIKSVMAGSAAEKAGLKPGDRLLTIDGRWTDSVGDTYQAAGFVKPGKTVPVALKRDGKGMKIMVAPLHGL